MENRQTILIAEDEPLNRKVLKKILQGSYGILEAVDGEEAWQIISEKKNKLAAVLLDIVMPIMTGYDVLAKIQEAGMEDLPVIVTTGNTDDEAEQRALDAGAWDFVTKPYNAKVLSSRLRNAIARSEVTAYEKMQHMAEHDGLTGLHNRGKLFAETRAMLDGHPELSFAIVRLDIDHFALYNASFGEAEGDTLLKFMADCVRESVAGCLFCSFGRISADVFCACFDYDGDRGKLRGKVEQVQRRLVNYRRDYRLEVSAGCFEIDDPSLGVEELYFRASVASQKCKHQYDASLMFYDAAMGRKLTAELAITNEMQAALDGRQFAVYFQPKFSLATESACGAEALVRWIHPVKGVVLPGDFIPVFESNGFISKLDCYVWEETCRMLRDWAKAGKNPFPVSVNISRVSLYNPHLSELMRRLVKKYEIPLSLLQLEVTESAYMTNPKLMEKTIESLRDAGFTILMDDFGSGYSSLNTLKRIKVDVLKVDMKFLPVKDETERGEIILACVIKMANWLGMSVVVEGVENRRQRDFLEGAGCDSVQGYYYSRPIPAAEYEEKYVGRAPLRGDGAPERQTSFSPRHKMTILVIDDSEAECVILRENFKDLYHVQMCSSAEEGLAYLRRNLGKVRLVLVDNQMPGMSGLDFLRYCGQNSALRSIPKIMMAGNDTVRDQLEAFEAGVYNYIAKPFVKEIVAARIKHVMEVSRRTSTFDTIEQDYKRKSELDPATGLLNKMSFRELATHILDSLPDGREALMVVDVDEFKQINDLHGHPAGDAVIACVAEELVSAFRKTDAIGRFGGDEFVVLMTKLPGHGIARRKAEEVVKSVTLNCRQRLHLNVSVSVGLSYSEAGDSVDTLFARSDQALYEAKSAGGGRAAVYGEKVPPIGDDGKPIVLLCGGDPQLYPAIALACGGAAAFAGAASLRELEQAFRSYGGRVRVICLDMQKQAMHDDAFYRYILSQGGGDRIPILAVCKEGNIDQLRAAVGLKICGVITLPPHKGAVQRRISCAIMEAERRCGKVPPPALG